jgi:predicted nucleic acid-binding protein
MNKVIIDANVLLALIDEKDKWHSEAKAIVQLLKNKKWDVVYLDCVINEVISVLSRRLEERKKPQDCTEIMNELEKLVPEENIEWFYPDVPDSYGEIIKLVKHKHGKINFHDALIALFAKEYKLGCLVSFDEDFDEIEWITRIKNGTEIERRL